LAMAGRDSVRRHNINTPIKMYGQHCEALSKPTTKGTSERSERAS
jgi:hypothetical protein